MVTSIELENMTKSYAISMWCKRQDLGMMDAVSINIAHIQNRFSTRIWNKRIQVVFDNLVDEHPYFFYEDNILMYQPKA